MSKKQLEEQRRKRGQCLSCGQKCFQKKLFKLIPLTEHGNVLNGRCLKCKPLDVTSNETVLPAASRPATRQDMDRFIRSQSSLRLQGPGVQNMRRTHSTSPMQRTPSHASVASSSGGTAPAVMGSGENGRHGAASYPHPPNLDGSARGYRATTGVPRINENDSASARTSRSAEDEPEGRSSSGRRRGRAINRSMSLQEPRVNPEMGGSRNHPSRTQSFDSPQGAQSPAMVAPSPILEDAPLQAPLTAGFPEESEQQRPDPMRAAVIGGMAARQIANNFRARKKAAAAAAAAVPESAPTDYADYAENLSSEQQANERIDRQERPGSVHSGESWKTGEDDIHNYEEPVHGILNRGGQFKFDEVLPLSGDGSSSAAPPFSTMNAESSRTMSSMSSVEEEPGSNGHRQLSWKPAAEFSMKKRASDVFEDIDDLSIDSDANTGSYRSKDRLETRSNVSSRSGRMSSSRSGRYAMQEQRAIETMSAMSKNFHEILVLMREFPSSSLVQQEALKHISNLHLTDSEYTELMEIGALQTVIRSMKTHIKHAELQSGACRAIWNLSATPQSQIALVDEGALDCILAAMDRYPTEAELQEKALAALSNLGAAAENQHVIMQKGAIQRIVEAMNKHSEDGPVQSKACSALTNFASYDSPLKRQIMELGGGGAVVISMIMHPEDIDLQEKALRALRNICANSDENKVEVANVGGIDAVISAMQVHRDEPGVQEAGAWTLSNLAVNPENKAVIGDSGGIDVVIRAMWVHSDNVGVQEWCCRALWTLSVDAHNRLVMMEVGGISAVVNAMQAHADAATVQEKGCGVLSNLAATDDDSKIRIVEEEALDAIIMAMVLHAENRAVQDRACSVLKRLAIGPNIKSMQAANVGELVRQAGRKFPDKCREKAGAILSVL